MTLSALTKLQRGGAIPAHPLALTQEGHYDFLGQRAITRYYLDAGVAGIAVGVHTTQFEIRDPRHALYERVLQDAHDAALQHERGDEVVLIAGVRGDLEAAVREARMAAAVGFDVALLAPDASGVADEERDLERAQAVGEVLPVMGFYMQDAVGGYRLSRQYWRRFAALPAVCGIKVAPFDRYRTFDVLEAVEDFPELPIFTGNDDTIAYDLLLPRPNGIVGGLLGQFAVGTRWAVQLLSQIEAHHRGEPVDLSRILGQGRSLTEFNAAVFDADNAFSGVIAGVNETLRQVGLLSSSRCLDPSERLSAGQEERIRRARAKYPGIDDQDFIKANLDRWRS